MPFIIQLDYFGKLVLELQMGMMQVSLNICFLKFFLFISIYYLSVMCAMLQFLFY